MPIAYSTVDIPSTSTESIVSSAARARILSPHMFLRYEGGQSAQRTDSAIGIEARSAAAFALWR